MGFFTSEQLLTLMLRNLSLKGNLFIVATWGNINRSLDWRALSSHVCSAGTACACEGGLVSAAQIPPELGKPIKWKVVSACKHNAAFVFRCLCPPSLPPHTFFQYLMNKSCILNKIITILLFCFAFLWKAWLIKYFNPCCWASLKWRLFPGSVVLI